LGGRADLRRMVCELRRSLGRLRLPPPDSAG